MNIHELAALISIRDFTFKSIDNILIKMSKEEVKILQSKLAVLNQKIIHGIMELNLSEMDKASKKENRKTEASNENTK